MNAIQLVLLVLYAACTGCARSRGSRSHQHCVLLGPALDAGAAANLPHSAGPLSNSRALFARVLFSSGRLYGRRLLLHGAPNCVARRFNQCQLLAFSTAWPTNSRSLLLVRSRGRDHSHWLHSGPDCAGLFATIVGAKAALQLQQAQRGKREKSRLNSIASQSRTFLRSACANSAV